MQEARSSISNSIQNNVNKKNDYYLKLSSPQKQIRSLLDCFIICKVYLTFSLGTSWKQNQKNPRGTRIKSKRRNIQERYLWQPNLPNIKKTNKQILTLSGHVKCIVAYLKITGLHNYDINTKLNKWFLFFPSQIGITKIHLRVGTKCRYTVMPQQ